MKRILVLMLAATLAFTLPVYARAETADAALALAQEAATKAAEAAQAAAQAAQAAADAAQAAADAAALLAGAETGADGATAEADTGEAVQTEEAQRADDLFGEAYNPFYTVPFPDTFTVYQARVELGEYQLFYLYLTAQDTAENVVEFLSALLGDDSQENIRQNLAYLEKDGLVGIEGLWPGTELRVICEVGSAEADDDIAAEGYRVKLSRNIDADTYRAFLDRNVNAQAMEPLAAYIGVAEIVSTSLQVNLLDSNTELQYWYRFQDAQKTKDEIVAAFPDDYNTENDWVGIGYGELNVNAHFFDAENGHIVVSQSLGRTDVCLADYRQSVTLKTLGFEDFREESAKCSYRDEANGIFMMISKDAWGENGNEGERNAVTYIRESDGESLLAFFYPQENMYLIQLDTGDSQAKYRYYKDRDAYTDDWGGDDLDAARDVAGRMFNKPGEDSILQDAWVTFEQYVEQTFGISPEDLYALPWE